jgi:hypothetical protein
METPSDGFETRVAQLLKAELREVQMTAIARDIPIPGGRGRSAARMAALAATAAAAVVAGVLVAGQLTSGGFGARNFELPVVADNGGICAGVGIEGTLRGDPTDPRVAWLQGPAGGRRDVVWPSGYTARFDPALTVRDADGKVQFREGDPITGACRVPGDYLEIRP